MNKNFKIIASENCDCGESWVIVHLLSGYNIRDSNVLLFGK